MAAGAMPSKGFGVPKAEFWDGWGCGWPMPQTGAGAANGFEVADAASKGIEECKEERPAQRVH